MSHYEWQSIHTFLYIPQSQLDAVGESMYVYGGVYTLTYLSLKAAATDIDEYLKRPLTDWKIHAPDVSSDLPVNIFNSWV